MEKNMNGNKGTKGTEKNMNKSNETKGKEKNMKKKYTPNDYRNIMNRAHEIEKKADYSIQFSEALRKAWKEHKEQRNSFANVPTNNEFMRMLSEAVEDKTMEKFAYYRLKNIVGNSLSAQDADGKQVELNLSVSAQKAYIHYGFYGFSEEAYKDYLQNVSLYAVKLISSDWIEKRNAKRLEDGKEPINKITDILWYASDYGWKATVKHLVHRMRKSNKTAQFEYFDVSSLDAKIGNGESDCYEIIDTQFNSRSLPTVDEFLAHDKLYSVTRDETDRLIIELKEAEFTQTEIAKACGLSQVAVSKRIKRMKEEYKRS